MFIHVCLSLSRITHRNTQKVKDGFGQNFHEWLTVRLGMVDL